MKPHETYPNEDEYDAAAADIEGDCNEKYLSCKGSLYKMEILARK